MLRARARRIRAAIVSRLQSSGKSVDAFVDRMRGLAGTKLQSFHETVFGTTIHVFGKIAVAVAACEMIENGTEVNRGVEMLLLIKDEGVWQIV